MGFPQSVCKTATSRIQINFNLATEFLLAQPILVQRARDKESARNLTNSSTSGQSTEAADATIDVSMGKASIAGPSSEIMGDGGSFRHFKSPNYTIPDEIGAQIITALGDLKDLIRSQFLKESIGLAQSYDGLVFDLKAAFKAFENKMASNNQKAGNLIGGASLAVEIKSSSLKSSAGDEDSQDLYRKSALGLYEGGLKNVPRAVREMMKKTQAWVI
ncbi:hypothetical protein PPACK8108_LOCUS19366 [Phakopsora pachyrhizi]|uniref:Uncharacterized protein n=1 Tax=Phakopsora pachyrhizi TaxID=170000 RepID=A0AAV0BCL5_PHAPC|nr:hypothetical protein PPACK8108_LOCUS19366 [Phakopsora pachyrhizi]